MFDNFTEFFFNLDDSFFEELYDSDYEKIKQLCFYLTLDTEMRRQSLRNGDYRLDD